LNVKHTSSVLSHNHQTPTSYNVFFSMNQWIKKQLSKWNGVSYLFDVSTWVKRKKNRITFYLTMILIFTYNCVVSNRRQKMKQLHLNSYWFYWDMLWCKKAIHVIRKFEVLFFLIWYSTFSDQGKSRKNW
jgi:hypothetical protein